MHTLLCSSDRDAGGCALGVDEHVLQHLPQNAPHYPVAEPGKVKLSAAWLIDQAGFSKGYGLEHTARQFHPHWLTTSATNLSLASTSLARTTFERTRPLS